MRAAALLLLATGACWSTDADPSSVDVTCEGRCVVDPRAHCIRDQCTSNSDCASGLVCIDQGPGSCAISDGGQCVPDTSQPNTSILIEQFRSRAMDLVVDEDTLRLTWTAPEGAWFVSCALFTCPPDIQPRPDESASDRGPVEDDPAYKRIANANACILEMKTTDSSRTSLRMEGALTEDLGPTCVDTEQVGTPIVSMLSAACWAYDSTKLVAASELVPLRPSALAMNALIPQEVTCELEEIGTSCHDAQYQFFGACNGARCMPRCRSARDCERAASSTLRLPVPDGCEWTCEPIEGTEIGVCARIP